MSMHSLAARLRYDGGSQLDRIKQQKLKSFQAALKNDYNSRLIQTPNRSVWPCLINTNNLKSDYDKKYISVEFSSGLEAGDVFQLLDDNTHWMVYLPILTETAYLRAEIIRCRYQIEIDDEKYWVYFQGPTETDLRWFIKNGVNYNELNLSGTIYIKNTPKTKDYFKRFTHIKLDGHMWEVQVTDSITVPGILELEIQEYYDNSIAELPEIKKEHAETAEDIIGQTEVKPDTIVGYQIVPEKYNPRFTWVVTDNDRVRVQEIMDSGRICKVRIHAGAIGDFTLQYGDMSIKVSVDWEKPIIHGPQEVYPYETHTYFLDKNLEGIFSIESSLATIIDQNGNYCKVEILTGRKGKFELQCQITKADYEDEILPINEEDDDSNEEIIDPDSIIVLPVTINSL